MFQIIPLGSLRPLHYVPNTSVGFLNTTNSLSQQRSRNLGLAAKALTASVVLSEGFMLINPGMSIHMMFLLLLDFPIVLFFLVFFFGQHHLRSPGVLASG